MGSLVVARSQTTLTIEGKSKPEFKDTADGDEAARWEAYCALQARKRRNGMQPASEHGMGFDPSPTAPFEPWDEGYASEDRSPVYRLSAAVKNAQTASPGLNGRRRWALSVLALAVVASGLVIAGSTLWHLPNVTRATAKHDSALVSPAPRFVASSAPAPVQAATSPVPPAFVATKTPAKTEIATARPRGRHKAALATHTRDKRDRQPQRQLVAAPRAKPHLEHARKANAVAPRRSIVQDRAAAPSLASQPNSRPRPEAQQRVAAAERPAASQRLTEYRASQSEYERELKSYEQAMSRYYAHGASEPPPPPRHSADPASALDALPWRR